MTSNRGGASARVTGSFVTAIGGMLLAGTTYAQVSVDGAITSYTLPTQSAQEASNIDFANAKPMPLPAVHGRPPTPDIIGVRPSMSIKAPGISQGRAPVNRRTNPTRLVVPQTLSPSRTPVPQQYGTSGTPFSTCRVDALSNNTSAFYPFSAAGKLYFNIGASTYVCSASLIKPGVIVTAAHCVADYGKSLFYTNWIFAPAFDNGVAPFGTFTASAVFITTSYFAGTDACAVDGIVCPNDVAVIVENKDAFAFYPGDYAGFLSYGWNGSGFNGASQALINQLGYPVALDSGLIMERNDSQSFVAPSFSNNNIIGSLMTGGSSGGPWAVNLGMPPILSGTSFGAGSDYNAVVGVTSWGYNDTAVKQMGASPFTTENIVGLVGAACGAEPAAC